MIPRERFFVIGITDTPNPFFPPRVLDIISSCRVFSGGKRHRELVDHLLPQGAEWIDITVPLDAVFDRYRAVTQQPIVVFASGDPLFFGFANTIRRQMPEAEVQVFPAFNSLQMLAHKMLLPYHDMRIVSLTGRPWPELDRALIEGASKIGILTDHHHTPEAIAQRMREYGYDNYTLTVGEHLGNPERERVYTLTEGRQAEFPNCVIAVQSAPRPRPFGIPDAAFQLLDGRTKMITKMPIRLLTLQRLELATRHVMWDVGACTGSVSIEARLRFPHLQVEAFEIRRECEEIITTNAHRFGAPGIGLHIGDFCATPDDQLVTLPAPDAVFIGGHGGHLVEIMTKVLQYMSPGGCIVMNSVSAQSRQLWDEACDRLHLKVEPPMRVALNEYNPIEILKCKR